MVNPKKTFIINGAGASSGLTYGLARIVYSWEKTVGERILNKTEIEPEMARLDNAINETLLEINRWKKMTGGKAGGPIGRIFDTQLMIASDQDFLSKVKDSIRSRQRNAEYIYSLEVEKTVEPLKNAHDEYMKQMVHEIEAVSKMVVSHLRGHTERDFGPFPTDTIIVGRNFTAAEILSLYDRKAKGIVTAEGSATSHMALVARSLLIPTVVAAQRAHLRIRSGDRLIIDGDSGEVTVNPQESAWTGLVKQRKTLSEMPLARLKRLPQLPIKTADGVEINLAANISLPGPVDDILSKNNIGVGLFRSEFIYLQKGNFPTSEEQFEIYDHVAATYHPHDVIIRTFDLGSDKYHQDDQFAQERNPALGWRGVRASLDMPGQFRRQIRAILRASHHGNVKLLLPMITDISEVKKAIGMIRRAMVQLRKERIKYDPAIKIGIMVEVPAVALNAAEIIPKVDFFSIGSNDLAQYVLAADRDNQRLNKIFNPLHPAVLKLIQMTIDAARAAGKPVSLCGEMAGDVLAIPLLIGMGVDSLSMNPARLYHVCNLITRLRINDAKVLAAEVLRLPTVRDVESRLLEFNMSM
jgi:phosphotransferase system enzyme I (PtsI)